MRVSAYSPALHRHRFACWTAARAVNRDFTSTKLVISAIENCGLRQLVENPVEVSSQEAFDRLHAQTCRAILAHWDEQSRTQPIKGPSYGRAAKVVSIYLKTSIGMRELGSHLLQPFLHPPIDRVLLLAMRKQLGYTIATLPTWIALTEVGYHEVLTRLKSWSADQPPPNELWRAERYWVAARPNE